MSRLNLYLSVGFMVVFFFSGVSVLYGVHGCGQGAVIDHNFFVNWIMISVLVGLVAGFFSLCFASAVDFNQPLKRPYYGSSSEEDGVDPNES